MYVRETWRIRNDSIRDKWSCSWQTRSFFLNLVGIGAGSPASIQYLSHTLLPLSNISVFYRLQAGNEPWILDHESHQLRWIASNIEEFQVILLNKFLERSMCS